MVHADFTLSLSGLCIVSRQFDLVVVNPKSSIVAVARNNGVKRAQEVKADYLFFVDSDMVFPANTLARLVAHEKDIVGAIYTKRLPPYELLGRTLDSHAACDENGLVEMRRIPTGCLLIRMSVFDQMQKPYFRFGVNEKTGGLLGEDYAFCDTVREMGLHIWADMSLSQEIGHIGKHICRVPTAEPRE